MNDAQPPTRASAQRRECGRTGADGNANSTIRRAVAGDVPEIFAVRTAVKENHLSEAQLAERGITPDTVVYSLATGMAGWVAEEGGRTVGFSLADPVIGGIFALFVLPAYEGRGHGTRLLEAAVAWLRERGHGEIMLDTGLRSSAVTFYQRRGWRRVEVLPSGEVRMVLPPC